MNDYLGLTNDENETISNIELHPKYYKELSQYKNILIQYGALTSFNAKLVYVCKHILLTLVFVVRRTSNLC